MIVCERAVCRAKCVKPATGEDLAVYQQIADNFWRKRDMKDVREMRNMLNALQNGELTVSRGMELLDMWLAGNYNDDMLPPAREGLGEDEMPWDRIDALTKQRDELLAAIEAHGHHKWCKRRNIIEMQRRGLFKDQEPPVCDCSFKDVLAKAQP